MDHVTLADSDLSQVSFAGVNLIGAVLDKSNLAKAELTGANQTGARLRSRKSGNPGLGVANPANDVGSTLTSEI